MHEHWVGRWFWIIKYEIHGLGSFECSSFSVLSFMWVILTKRVFSSLSFPVRLDILYIYYIQLCFSKFFESFRFLFFFLWSKRICFLTKRMNKLVYLIFCFLFILVLFLTLPYSFHFLSCPPFYFRKHTNAMVSL